MRSFRTAATVFAIAVIGSGGAWAADIGGVWLTENGNARVRVAPCGGGYCGTIVSAQGQALDSHNADPALRGRSVVGVQILTTQRAEGDGYAGSLYNPNDGKTYSGTLRATGPDSLEVSGCVLGVFCKRQTWTRVR